MERYYSRRVRAIAINRRQPQRQPRQPVNHNIRAPQVLLIDHEGTNHGLTDTTAALDIARDAGLDLVVVSEGKDVPVARVMDFGKHQYQKKKRQNASAKATLKEVKMRPNIGESDYTRWIDSAQQWLGKGDAVKFQVRLRGREHQHRDRATELLQRIASDLETQGKVQSFDRRALVLQLVPA